MTVFNAELMALFGDIAPRLGLSRPAGQCLAAIWRSAQAPSAEDLMAQVGISRSNVSTALRDLRAWGLVQVLRAPGDRREYFTAPHDPWVLIRAILAERQRREIAPVLDRLYQIEAETADVRIAALCEVAETLSGWMTRLTRLEPAELADHLLRKPAADQAADDAPRKKKKKK